MKIIHCLYLFANLAIAVSASPAFAQMKSSISCPKYSGERPIDPNIVPRRSTAISDMLHRCWKPVSSERHLPPITLLVSFEKNGCLDDTSISAYMAKRYNRDRLYRSVVDRAMRAIRSCTPLLQIPSTPYETWKDTLVTFKP